MVDNLLFQISEGRFYIELHSNPSRMFIYLGVPHPDFIQRSGLAIAYLLRAYAGYRLYPSRKLQVYRIVTAFQDEIFS